MNCTSSRINLIRGKGNKNGLRDRPTLSHLHSILSSMINSTIHLTELYVTISMCAIQCRIFIFVMLTTHKARSH